MTPCTQSDGGDCHEYVQYRDILETIEMFTQENLDVRTVTMGISLLDCIDPDPARACEKIYRKITTRAAKLVPTVESIATETASPSSTSDQRHAHRHAAGRLPRRRPGGFRQDPGRRRQGGGGQLCGRLYRPGAQGLFGRGQAADPVHPPCPGPDRHRMQFGEHRRHPRRA